MDAALLHHFMDVGSKKSMKEDVLKRVCKLLRKNAVQDESGRECDDGRNEAWCRTMDEIAEDSAAGWKMLESFATQHGTIQFEVDGYMFRLKTWLGLCNSEWNKFIWSRHLCISVMINEDARCTPYVKSILSFFVHLLSLYSGEKYTEYRQSRLFGNILEHTDIMNESSIVFDQVFVWYITMVDSKFLFALTKCARFVAFELCSFRDGGASLRDALLHPQSVVEELMFQSVSQIHEDHLAAILRSPKIRWHYLDDLLLTDKHIDCICQNTSIRRVQWSVLNEREERCFDQLLRVIGCAHLDAINVSCWRQLPSQQAIDNIRRIAARLKENDSVCLLRVGTLRRHPEWAAEIEPILADNNIMHEAKVRFVRSAAKCQEIRYLAVCGEAMARRPELCDNVNFLFSFLQHGCAHFGRYGWWMGSSSR
mmetsp:Transcript_28936/g.81520  ORF Transcript_28936/g.81520 Transcript_28936/m.81520 type:complete len:424 (+) Transcript_28936:2-1273(+)